MAEVISSTLSRYEVVASGGLTLGDKTYPYGSRVSLTPNQAYYLELSGSIKSLTGQLITPPTDYVPPPIGPVTPTESNTLVGIVVSGTATYVTIDNLVNLFPKLQPARGEPGPQGERGPQGGKGDRGPSVAVNGHLADGDGNITLTAADVNLGNVVNLAPDDLPVSRATSQAIAVAVAQILDQIASGGGVDVDALAAIVATKASKAELSAAVGSLKGTASAAASDLGKVEALVANARALAEATDLRVSNILAGASSDVDTFLEVLNRFISVESAEAAIVQQLGTKASQTSLDALAATVASKAAQSALDTLTQTVSGKASQSALDTLSALVNLKASQISLDALSSSVQLLRATADPITLLPILPTLDLIFAGQDAVGPGRLQRNSVGAFTRASGVGALAQPNVLRIDHDPISGRRLGAMFEATASNLVPNSANLAGAYGQSNTVVTNNQGLGALGTLTLAKVQATADGTSYVQIPYTVPSGDGVTRTMSVYLRQGTSPGATVQFQYSGQTFSYVEAYIDWATKTATAAAGNPTLVDLGNGLFRFSLTFANTQTGNNQALFLIAPRSGGINAPKAGDTVFAGDIMVETGNRMSSYVPTSGAAATRPGDVLNMGQGDWFSAVEGSAIVEFWFDPVKCDPTQYQRIFQATGLDGTFQNVYSFTMYPGGNLGLSCQRAGTFVGDLFVSDTNGRKILAGLNRAAFSYSAARGVTVSTNGFVTNVPTTGAVPAFKGLEIGSGAGLYQANCPISRATYFPKQLSDAQLASLTSI